MNAKVTFNDKEIEESVRTIYDALDLIQMEVLKLRAKLGVEIDVEKKDTASDN